MIDLKTASIGIRKAAALRGIWRGKVTLLSPTIEYSDDPVMIEVMNKNNPEGILIYGIDCDNADMYTWAEIKAQMRPYDNCE